MVCDNLDWTTLFWWLEHTRTPPQKHTPHKHHHANTTTQTPPQKHHHTNTTTKKTPPQKHSSTTPVLQSTLPVLLRITKYYASTTKYYSNRLFLSNRASLSLCSWPVAVRNYIRHCGPRPQRHRSLTVKQSEWPNPTRWSPKSLDDNKIFLFLKDLDDILVARYLATQPFQQQ